MKSCSNRVFDPLDIDDELLLSMCELKRFAAPHQDQPPQSRLRNGIGGCSQAQLAVPGRQ